MVTVFIKYLSDRKRVGMLITEEDMIETEMMVREWDYPEGYVGKMHPYDRKNFVVPINPETTLLTKLFFRIAIKISEDKYIPFTFVCDTGLPGYLYLSETTRDLIAPRILSDEFSKYIIFNDKKIKVSGTPPKHEDCNFMGLRILSILGLQLFPDHFTFRNMPSYI